MSGAYMFDDPNQILEQGLSLFVCDDCSCEVAEHVRTTCLYSIQVAGETRYINLF